MDNNNHLVVKFYLDRHELTDTPTGSITIRIEKDNGHVLAVQPTPCTLVGCRNTMETMYKEFGDILLEANAQGSIFDYEYIYSTMDAQLTELNEAAEVQKKLWDDEKNLKTANKVLEMLSSQSFDDFYQGMHMDHIEGGPDAPSRVVVLQAIIDKFIKKF